MQGEVDVELLGLGADRAHGVVAPHRVVTGFAEEQHQPVVGPFGRPAAGNRNVSRSMRGVISAVRSSVPVVYTLS